MMTADGPLRRVFWRLLGRCRDPGRLSLVKSQFMRLPTHAGVCSIALTAVGGASGCDRGRCASAGAVGSGGGFVRPPSA
jgi:hypothetical protein